MQIAFSLRNLGYKPFIGLGFIKDKIVTLQFKALGHHDIPREGQTVEAQFLYVRVAL
jgi:hypothetical protein